jgi:hypothetical protein
MSISIARVSSSDSMYSTSALRPRGREISGFDEMCASRWSPAISSRRSASRKTVSVGLWPGRKCTSSERPANSSTSPGATTWVTFAREPHARNASDTDWSALVTSSGMPWRSIASVAKASSAAASAL